jgi:endonuclease/exonuclease/phosphatase (EEP) superfamily protein YafD
MAYMTFFVDILAACLFLISAAPFMIFLPRLSARLSPLVPHAGVALILAFPLAFFAPFAINGTAWIFLICAAALNIWHGLPMILPQRKRALRKQAFTLFQANVLRSNLDAGPLLREIARQDPDVIVLCELTPDFAKQLQPLSYAYPHYKADARNDSFGMGVFSRLPLVDADVFRLSAADVPAIMTGVETPLGTVTLLSLHPHNPLKDTLLRDMELTAAAQWMKLRKKAPTVVTGDLNVTPFCLMFRRLLRISGYQHARLGRGQLPTWPVFLPSGPWRIAIDHTLVSPPLEITAFRLGARIGSDHLPSFAQISFVK